MQEQPPRGRVQEAMEEEMCEMGTYEIDANGGDIDVRIVAVGETNEKGRFATSAVAHDDDLEEVVAARPN